MNKRIRVYKRQQKRLTRIISVLLLTTLFSTSLAIYGVFIIGAKEQVVNTAKREANEYRRIAEIAKKEVKELHKQISELSGAEEN